MQSQPVIVPYVRPSVGVPRRYVGVKVRRGTLKVYKGGKSVRSRETILAMVGRKM